MSSNNIMRTSADRLRHTILFEVLLLLVVTPICMMVFHTNAQTATFTAVALSLIAMIWNYVFNYLFDYIALKLKGTTKKTKTQRVYHALIFEVGLLVFTIPLLAWALDLSFIDAFLTDLGFVVGAVVYAYFFNLFYDSVFPIPETQK